VIRCSWIYSEELYPSDAIAEHCAAAVPVGAGCLPSQALRTTRREELDAGKCIDKEKKTRGWPKVAKAADAEGHST
jgi:hypothetical protein